MVTPDADVWDLDFRFRTPIDTETPAAGAAGALSFINIVPCGATMYHVAPMRLP